jgi:hypothetical protein
MRFAFGGGLSGVRPGRSPGHVHDAGGGLPLPAGEVDGDPAADRGGRYDVVIGQDVAVPIQRGATVAGGAVGGGSVRSLIPR